MAERILLSGGRTVVALEVARQLHRAGHTVFLVDCFGRTLTAHSRAVAGAFQVPSPRFETARFVAALGAVMKRARIDRFLPLGEEILYVARARAALGAGREIFCDEAETLLALHDKAAFARVAAALGPALPTWDVTSAAELGALVAAHGPLVLKRRFSRSGCGVQVVRTPPVSALAPGPWVAQPLVAGRELCAFVIAHQGRVLAHVTYLPRFRFPLGPGFYFEPVTHEPSRVWMERFVRGHRLTGNFGVDFMDADDGALYPLECNPRATSGVHLFATNGALADAYLGRAAASAGGRPAMIAPVMLTVGLAQARSLAALGGWLRAFVRARDVVAARRDRGPLYNFFASGRELRALQRNHQLSFRAATSFLTQWEPS